MKLFDSSKPDVQLCSYTIQAAAASQAVIMCVVERNTGEGNWNIFEVGKLSDGDVMNYTPIMNTISNMLNIMWWLCYDGWSVRLILDF